MLQISNVYEMAKISPHRVNLSVQEGILNSIRILAQLDGVSLTTKAYQLLKIGLEMEEDRAFALEAESRLAEIESGEAKLLDHEEFWQKALSA